MVITKEEKYLLSKNKYFGNKTEDIIHKSLNHANITDFSPLPFCILDNQLGQDIQQCFDEANIIPKIYLKNNQTKS